MQSPKHITGWHDVGAEELHQLPAAGRQCFYGKFIPKTKLNVPNASGEGADRPCVQNGGGKLDKDLILQPGAFFSAWS